MIDSLPLFGKHWLQLAFYDSRAVPISELCSPKLNGIPQLTHLTQRCEDVAVGARMPEPFAKAPVALSHRTASWLPRCRLFPEKNYQSCNHGTPHSHGPGLAKRNQQQSWSKPQVTAKVPLNQGHF